MNAMVMIVVLLLVKLMLCNTIEYWLDRVIKLVYYQERRRETRI
jgi:hypothetical protein